MKHYTLYTEVFDYICSHNIVDTRELVDIFQKRQFTKQGLYKVLKRLREEGKILMRRTQVSINYVWLIREIRKLSALLPLTFSLTHETYTHRRIYTVKTLNELDSMFGQIFVSLLVSLPEKLPEALFYDLHNYTYIHKVPMVDLYIDLLSEKVEQTCLLIGSTSPLDYALKKSMRIPVHLIPKRWDNFISVIGDYIIYNKMDPHIWKKIDTIFNTMKPVSASPEIQLLAQERGRYKITVLKDKKKSAEIRQVFEKYFVLKHI